MWSSSIYYDVKKITCIVFDSREVPNSQRNQPPPPRPTTDYIVNSTVAAPPKTWYCKGTSSCKW